MAMPYFELRKQSARGTDSIAADIMRHLHARQHLGKTIVVSRQSVALLAASRKQWLKLARLLQKQRASTLNAEKILKYTHTITHMQHMRFTAKLPIQEPKADVYFLAPTELQDIPLHCYTIYVTTPLGPQECSHVANGLPEPGLLVDYAGHAEVWERNGMLPKRKLEQQVDRSWQQLCAFIVSKQVNVSQLIHDSTYNMEAMEEALDVLLGVARSFLQHANEFQRSLELARPLRISKNVRQQYDALILLAHRVQALMPDAYSHHFLESYNEDDTFFLYRPSLELPLTSGESIEEAVLRNRKAGRLRLAAALYQAASNWRVRQPTGIIQC